VTVAPLRAKVMSVMLIELWERLRGYDKWVHATATVEASDPTYFQSRGHDYSRSDDVIVWCDSAGEKHRAQFTVQVGSPLFQLVQGSKVDIRYNPADPEQYYFRELLKTRIRQVASPVKIAALVFAVLVIIALARSFNLSK
jgi:hypothetical protein